MITGDNQYRANFCSRYVALPRLREEADFTVDRDGVLIVGRHLKWDTELFGVSCARLDYIGVTEAGELSIAGCLEEFVRLLQRAGIRFCDARCATEQAILCRTLAEAGFRQIDTLNIYLAFDPPEVPSSVPPGHSLKFFDVVPCQTLESLVGFGRSAFTDARIFRDGRFDRVQAEKFYERMLRDTMSSGENRIGVITTPSGDAAGFFVAASAADTDPNVTYLSTIAVNPEVAGKGLGSALTKAFVTDALRSSAIAEIGTQTTNVAANAMYMKCGLAQRCQVSSFHYWLPMRE